MKKIIARTFAISGIKDDIDVDLLLSAPLHPLTVKSVSEKAFAALQAEAEKSFFSEDGKLNDPFIFNLQNFMDIFRISSLTERDYVENLMKLKSLLPESHFLVEEITPHFSRSISKIKITEKATSAKLTFILHSTGKERKFSIRKDDFMYFADSSGGIYRGGYKTESSGPIFHGQGIFYFKDGDYYEGQYKDGHYHGQGAIYRRNLNGEVVASYVGEFKNGQLEGVGEWDCPTAGIHYKGHFKKGEKAGHGTLTVTENRDNLLKKVFTGNFKGRDMQGQKSDYYSCDTSLHPSGIIYTKPTEYEGRTPWINLQTLAKID